MGVLTPLQRSSRCILQPQLTGQCNILVRASLKRVYYMTEVIHIVEGNRRAWEYCGSQCADTFCIASFYVKFESHTDNVHRIPVLELILYEFEMDQNAAEFIKNNCCLKDVGAVDHCLLTKCLRCPWCNAYRRRIWARRHEFKSWTRSIAFHIALIPLGNVWIQLFSLQLWVNSRAD